MAALNALARSYWEMPPVTRTFIAASALTTLAVQMGFISAFALYFNTKLIFRSHQYWRLITCFLYFRPLSLEYLLNLMFTYRYSRMLEEEFYQNRTADFFYMLLIGGTLMCSLGYFLNLIFLTHAFTIMIVYVWSRRNPAVRMNFFGLIVFQAPWLPWVLLTVSILLGSSTVTDIIGIIVGHFYYFFEDVFPNEPYGFRLLETPRFIKNTFTRLGIDEPPLTSEDRPEQFNFAQDDDLQAEPNNENAPAAQDDTQQQEARASSNDAAATVSSASESTARRPTNDETLQQGLRARAVVGSGGHDD